MSDPQSALGGAKFDGFASLRDGGLRGMITLRGDLGDKGFQNAVAQLSDLGMPERGGIVLSGDTGVAWMSPDEVLIMTPYQDVASHIRVLDDALAGQHYLATNVSDARAVLVLSGAGSREVLGKLTPADLSPDVMRPGIMRRTRLAQIPAAFWMTNDTDFELVCFRSVAQYAFALLSNAAVPGTEVGHYAR